MSNGSSLRSCGMAVLRIVVGVVFLMHGWQKFSMGFHNVGGFLGQLGIPAPQLAAVVLTLLEFFGGIALIVGFFTRGFALLLAIDMLVAILAFHIKHGFFSSGGGIEFPLTLLAANLCLLFSGAGSISVDSFTGRKKTG